MKWVCVAAEGCSFPRAYYGVCVAKIVCFEGVVCRMPMCGLCASRCMCDTVCTGVGFGTDRYRNTLMLNSSILTESSSLTPMLDTLPTGMSTCSTVCSKHVVQKQEQCVVYWQVHPVPHSHVT